MKHLQTIDEINERVILFQSLQLLGALFFIVGMYLNFVVIVGNKGMMPVQADYLTDGYEKTHFNYSYENRTSVEYWYLSDVIYIGSMEKYWMICSIGDITLWIGIGLVLYSAGANLGTLFKKTRMEKERRRLVSDENLAGPKRYNILLELINWFFKKVRKE